MTEDAPSKQHGWIRENVEAIVVAFVLALLIRHFAMEAFVIPTGSMAPTLLGAHVDLTCTNCGKEQPVSNHIFRRGSARASPGNAQGVCRKCGTRYARDLPEDAFVAGKAEMRCERCGQPVVMYMAQEPAGAGDRVVSHTCGNCGARYENRLSSGFFPTYELWPTGSISRGDRILVDKFTYRFRDPRRYEVLVFKFPDNPSENYIKRLVGLPGETIDVRGGDIYIDGKIARKPLDVQEECWLLEYDSRYVEKNPQAGADGRRAFRHEGGLFAQTPEKTGWVAKLVGPQPAWLVYNREILDKNRYNEAESQAKGLNVVADVRVSFDATLPEKAAALARLTADDEAFEAEVVDGRAVLRSKATGGGAAWTEVAHGAVSFAAGEAHRVELGRADGQIVLVVDGEVVLRHAFLPSGKVPEKSEVRLGARGPGGAAEATFDAIAVHRDLFYLSHVSTISRVSFPFRIPAGQYFVMGDNSANSTDSRAWKTVPAGHIVGRAFLVFWPALPGDFAVRRIR